MGQPGHRNSDAANTARTGTNIPRPCFLTQIRAIPASACGFTPQFAGLESLWKDYGPQGLVVVGFPSNEFGGQDPGSNDEIASFCQLNYGVSFPMMAKVKVNGSDAHPLWQWLKGEAPGFLGTELIKWNFTKFLVGKDGQVIRRYAPNDTPAGLRKDIEKALAS